MRRYLIYTLLSVFMAMPRANAGDTLHAGHTVHFQQTIIYQYHPAFSAQYSGHNSQKPQADGAYSLTATLFMGQKLWQGGAVYFDPEMAGGRGVGSTLGIGGFPNGETFRIGSPEPTVYVGRLFLRQTFPLKGERSDTLEDGPNTLADIVPSHRLVLTGGKYAMSDIFDGNRFAHDPRTQFYNWGLMASGAWDYAANTRGYTYALSAEYISPGWIYRLAAALEPDNANGPYLDLHIGQAHAFTGEVERVLHHSAGRETHVRVLGFYNQANMGSYSKAVEMAKGDQPDISLTRSYAHTKIGLALNLDYDLAEDLGIFGRISYNDGRHETWAFTEIDRSVSLGAVLNGKSWGRKADQAGLALLANGLSNQHRDYLHAGGLGFMLGDGRLHYAPEAIVECYYACHLASFLVLTPDYQLILNPGYNRDRGPVNLFGLRAHVEI